MPYKTQYKTINDTLQTANGAFSLTEMSIVLVIVGLLVAAVFKGQNLIEEAKIQSVMSEISSHRMAIQNFNTKYGQLPGDFNAADKYWSAAAKGDNNGRVEFKNSNNIYESYGLWQQLSLSEMTDVVYAATVTTGTPSPGVNIPKSKIGGGYMVDYSNSASIYDGSAASTYGILQKNIIMLGDIKATSLSPVQAGGILTPSQAMALDSKIDDGNPTTGSILGANGVGVSTCLSASVYNVTGSGKVCVVIMKVGE